MRDDETPEPTDNRWSSPTAAHGVLRLTYDQIGRRLGMTADAARQLARRKGWPRTRPNTIGEPVVVSVPTSELSSEQPPVHRRTTYGELSVARRTTDDEPSVTGANLPSVDRRSDLHAQALGALEDALTAANTRAQEAMTLADRLAVQFAEASARADAEITTLRDAVAGLRDTVARAEHRAAHAERRATEADARVIQAKALVADLDAKVARLNEAEAAAETLRTNIEELRAGQATHARELEQAVHAADQAQHQAQEATQALDQIRRADEARKARGRWARLRAAWRGE